MAVRRPLTWDKLLNAVIERRLFIVRETSSYTREAYEDLPKGVPTLVSVESAIREAGFKLEGDLATENGFLVEEMAPGEIRVRWGGYATRTKHLTKLLPHLSEYASMLSAGSGSYASEGEILLRAKPHTKGWYGGPRKEEEAPLQVKQAMIREDVWQALLKMNVKWRYSSAAPRGIAFWKTALRAETTKAVKHAKEQQKLQELLKTQDAEMALTTAEVIKLGNIIRPFGRLGESCFSDPVPFSVGPAYHAQLLLKSGALPASFVTAWAELQHVQNVLSIVGRPWRAEGIGHQGGEWEMWGLFQQALHPIVSKNARHVAKERNRYELEQKRYAAQAAKAAAKKAKKK